MKPGVDSQDLVWFRRVYAFLLLVSIPSLDWAWAGDYPSVMFHAPAGPLAPMTGPPPAWVLTSAVVGVVACAVLLLLGRLVVLSSIAITCLLIFGFGVTYSFGKIDHDILWVLTPAVLAAAGWSGRREPAAVVMRLWAFAISLGMLGAGVVKLLSGWLDPATQAVRGTLVAFVHVQDRSGPLGGLALDTIPTFAWEAMDWATVIMECGLVAVVWSWRWFRRGLAVLCLFHAGVWLMLGIKFTGNVIAYAAFVRWGSLSRWIGATAGAIACVVVLIVGTAEPSWLTALIVATGGLFGAVHLVRGTQRSMSPPRVPTSTGKDAP